MHVVNSCANDIQHTENNQPFQNANYHLNRFLTAWSSFSCLIISAALPADLKFNVCCSSRLH